MLYSLIMHDRVIEIDLDKVGVVTMRRGLFICIEGIDGSGKTTHARLLVEKLRRLGYNALYTTEPSDGEIGNFIRKHVLHGEKRLPVTLEALLFAADRIDHLEKEVKPALKSGKMVICDRYLYSSLAYQGAAGLDLRWIENINKWAMRPDLTVLIDVSPGIVMERLKREKSVMETLENQKKVRAVYMRLVRKYSLKVVNGNRPIPEVSSDIFSLVEKFIAKSGLKP